MDARPILAQPHLGRAPVHLRLLAGLGLEAHGRHRLGPRRIPPWPDVAHHRRVRALVAVLSELLEEDLAVVADLRSATAQKLPPRVQGPASFRPPLRPPRLPQPLAHRLDVQTQLPRDRFLRQTPLPQGTNRSPLVLFDHVALRGASRRHGEFRRDHLGFCFRHRLLLVSGGATFN